MCERRAVLCSLTVLVIWRSQCCRIIFLDSLIVSIFISKNASRHILLDFVNHKFEVRSHKLGLS